MEILICIVVPQLQLLKVGHVCLELTGHGRGVELIGCGRGVWSSLGVTGVFGAHWPWQGCLELIGCDRGVWSSLCVTGVFGAHWV